VELTRNLALTCNDMSIAAILNRLGYRTGRENTWTESRVRSLRTHHGIAAAPRPEERQWLTLAQSAAQLGTSVGFVRGLMRQRLLPARQTVAHAPWIIDRADLELPAVTGAVKNLRQGLRRPRLESHPSQTSLFPER